MTAEVWKTLRVGDCIRIIGMPDEVWAPHGETKALFQHLVDHLLPVKVCRVDEDGYPWIEYTHTSEDGTEYWESLMIHHDAIEVITVSD
jgi:hypothetical protein